MSGDNKLNLALDDIIKLQRKEKAASRGGKGRGGVASRGRGGASARGRGRGRGASARGGGLGIRRLNRFAGTGDGRSPIKGQSRGALLAALRRRRMLGMQRRSNLGGGGIPQTRAALLRRQSQQTKLSMAQQLVRKALLRQYGAHINASGRVSINGRNLGTISFRRGFGVRGRVSGARGIALRRSRIMAPRSFRARVTAPARSRGGGFRGGRRARGAFYAGLSPRLADRLGDWRERRQRNFDLRRQLSSPRGGAAYSGMRSDYEPQPRRWGTIPPRTTFRQSRGGRGGGRPRRGYPQQFPSYNQQYYYNQGGSTGGGRSRGYRGGQPRGFGPPAGGGGRGRGQRGFRRQGFGGGFGGSNVSPGQQRVSFTLNAQPPQRDRGEFVSAFSKHSTRQTLNERFADSDW